MPAMSDDEFWYPELYKLHLRILPRITAASIIVIIVLVGIFIT